MRKSDTAFVDTTIHVDRVLRKGETRYMDALDQVCASFGIRITSAFSKLEFKNVVLLGLRCVASWIEEEGSFGRTFVRAARVQTRRAATLTNIAAFVLGELDRSVGLQQGDSLDAALTEQASVHIYNAIEYFWYRFEKQFDSVSDAMKCRRALEGPQRSPSGKVTIRNSRSQCRSMTCNNAGFYVSQTPQVRKVVRTLQRMIAANDERITGELRKIVETDDYVSENRDRLYDFGTCVGIGDLWIHLEALREGASTVITTNYRESDVLCDILGLRPQYPPGSDAANAHK